MLDFYSTSGESPVAERAAIMLEECGLKYNLHNIEVGKGANKPKEFLRLSPRGTVPLLVDTDSPSKPVAIVQAGAILLYLAEKTGQFLPKALGERAVVYQWFMAALTDAQPTSMSAFLAETAMPGDSKEAVRFFEAGYIDLCRSFDQRLAKVKYLAGDEISIADIALITTIVYRRRLVNAADGLENLQRWIKTIRARPAVDRVLGNR
jgi:GST-like protein